MNVLWKRILCKLWDDLRRDLKFFNLHQRLFFLLSVIALIWTEGPCTLSDTPVFLPVKVITCYFYQKNMKTFFRKWRYVILFITKAELKFCKKETKTVRFDSIPCVGWFSDLKRKILTKIFWTVRKLYTINNCKTLRFIKLKELFLVFSFFLFRQ